MTGQRLPSRCGFVHYQTFVLVGTIMLMLHHAPAARADILVYQMLNDQIVPRQAGLQGRRTIRWVNQLAQICPKPLADD
ncbi:AGAP002028-PA-like protein [Anopheles sinensis]|uniref:AGAP002028-PA-like protein n=1 Tax=Anopheles sinensis TaxID=74873 RepID=A0A084VTV8_ANOSI|nr:AGAP002028-PA-like protein [Anopheles sinensis]